MEIGEERRGSAAIFKLKGRLDSVTSPEVEKRILASITSGHHDIILDFSALEYLSSAGIRVLVHCHKKLQHDKGHIVLVAIPKPIENVLYITGFLPYFRVFDGEEKAIVALSKKAS